MGPPGSPPATVALTQPKLQPMDLTSLKAVVAELAPALLPSRFEKAQQGRGHALQLGLRSLNGIHWLELSWQAEAPRLHAIAPPPRQGEGSTLAQQLQHGLRGLALIHLQQVGWARVPSTPCGNPSGWRRGFLLAVGASRADNACSNWVRTNTTPL